MHEENIVIVTRHVGTVEWLNKQGVHGRLVSRARPNDVIGNIVIGNPPLHLAYLARRVGIVDLPDLPTRLRGRELSADQMERYGAKITWYTVTRDEDEGS